MCLAPGLVVAGPSLEFALGRVLYWSCPSSSSVLRLPFHFYTSSHPCSPPAPMNKVSPALVVWAGLEPHISLVSFPLGAGAGAHPATTVSLSLSGVSGRNLARGEGSPKPANRKPHNPCSHDEISGFLACHPLPAEATQLLLILIWGIFPAGCKIV